MNRKGMMFALVVLALGLSNYQAVGQTAISALPYTISTPGAYYLSTNLTMAKSGVDGITITADDVTINLNGYCLTGAGPTIGTTGRGIVAYSSARRNIRVYGGVIRNWRLDGVYLQGTNHSVRDVHAFSNGAVGIQIVGSGVVTDCISSDNGPGINGYGIVCNGAGSLILRNVCRSNGNRGIQAGDVSVVVENSCTSNGAEGIVVGSSCKVGQNVSDGNRSHGILVLSVTTKGTLPASGTVVVANSCRLNGGNGIGASGCSTIQGNSCLRNMGHGIAASYGATISHNSCMQNSSRGIRASEGAVISENECDRNYGGIYVGGRCSIKNNSCAYNPVSGVEAGSDCRIVNNQCSANGTGPGIVVTGADNVIESNTVTDNGTGIRCNPATGNYIAQNRASGNTVDYNIVAGNTVGAGDLANVAF